jgi:hypothetical protein
MLANWMAYYHDYLHQLHSSKKVAHSASLWIPELAPNAERLPGRYGMTGAGRTTEGLIKVEQCCIFIALFGQN